MSEAGTFALKDDKVVDMSPGNWLAYGLKLAVSHVPCQLYVVVTPLGVVVPVVVPVVVEVVVPVVVPVVVEVVVPVVAVPVLVEVVVPVVAQQHKSLSKINGAS